MLWYEGHIGDVYSKLGNVYKRCKYYDEKLIWEPHQMSHGNSEYNSFDPYITHLAHRHQEIKSSRAYGYDRDF